MRGKVIIGMKRKGFGSRLWSQMPLQIMVWPGIIFMIIFCYMPIYGLSVAFKHYTVVDTFQSAQWVGFENFKIAFSDKFFWDSVGNTLAISFLKILIGFPLPIILAIQISELPNGRFKKMVQTISYLPHFLSWVVLGGMVINWMSTTGAFSTILLSLGVIDKPVNYLLQPDKYWLIAALTDVWKEAGWNTILYLAVIASIDPTYYEAARIDGAGKLRQIWYITLPLMRRIIALTFTLTIGGLLGSNLDQTLVLMNAINRPKAEVINSYVFRMGLTQGDFSYATAVGLAISIVSLILVLSTNALTKRLNDSESIF